MLERIDIKNFKAIQGDDKPLILNNLANVNYLVGANGCGKSSVLEGINLISNLKNTSNSNYLINNPISKKFSIKLELIIREKELKCEYYILDQDFKSDMEKNIIQTITYSIDTDFVNGNKVEEANFSLDKLNQRIFHTKEDASSHKQELKNINDILAILQKPDIKVSNSQTTNFYDLEIDKKYLTQSNVKINPINLASGIKQLFILHKSIYKKILNTIKTLNTNYFGIYNLLIIIEEPENHLHPDYQKTIPKLINNIHRLSSSVLNANANNYTSVQFLISTHSPFIISAAAKEENQKVYLIEEGQTKDIYGNRGEGIEGYENSDCIFAVNSMLGSGLEDIFPSTIFFCENSFAQFLRTYIETNKLNIKPAFITGGGDSDFLGKSQLWAEIIKQLNEYQRNQYVKTDIKIVIDKNIELEEQIKKLKTKNLGNCLIELEKDEQEKYFWDLKENQFRNFLIENNLNENWDYNIPKTSTFTRFLNQNGLNKNENGITKEEKINRSKRQGKIKDKLAKKMGEIFTEEDFKKFNIYLYNFITQTHTMEG